MASVPETRLPYPLRLPLGTVRAVIAIMVTATYAYLLVQGAEPVPPVLVNSVIVIVAFYFGSRATARSAGTMPTSPPPSRRPRVVQGLLLIGFVGLTAWFLRQTPTLDAVPPELLSVLEVLAGYVAGLVVAWILQRRIDVSSLRRRLATLARDLIAVGSLGLTGYLCFILATSQTGLFGDRTEEVLALVVTFYFGSRVSDR